jgi:hypothetical protein
MTDADVVGHRKDNTIIVLKALGQEHIDQVLRMSETYKKSTFVFYPTHSHSQLSPISLRRISVLLSAYRPPIFNRTLTCFRGV